MSSTFRPSGTTATAFMRSLMPRYGVWFQKGISCRADDPLHSLLACGENGLHEFLRHVFRYALVDLQPGAHGFLKSRAFFRKGVVAAAFKDNHLRIGNASVQPLSLRGRAEEVLASRQNERRSSDFAEARPDVVIGSELSAAHIR